MIPKHLGEPVVKVSVGRFEPIQLLDEVADAVGRLLEVALADDQMQALVDAAVDVVRILLKDPVSRLAHLLPILARGER